MVRLVSDDLDELIQQSLAPIQSPTFVLASISAATWPSGTTGCACICSTCSSRRCCAATFSENGKWQLRSIATISASEVPESHWPFVVQVATEHFAGRRVAHTPPAPTPLRPGDPRQPKETDPPSNEQALQRFVKAAESLGIEAEIVDRDDYARLAEFDALFIRETTAVNHHTYRFAPRGRRRAGRHRRPGVDRQMHQQGVSGRAR